MKQRLLALLLVSFASTSALADSPEAILKDYRKQASQAVERLNLSLKNATTPLITKLLSSGDTAGAELLTAQLKDKLSGEPVAAPQASAAQLFALYDGARAKALAPVQKASIARIESLLKTAGGAKADTVTALIPVRAEVESGQISQTLNFPALWTYHMSAESPAMAELTFTPDGKWSLKDIKSANVSEYGEWVQKGRFALELNWKGSIWKMTIDRKTGILDRPDVGKRYLKLPPKA